MKVIKLVGYFDNIKESILFQRSERYCTIIPGFGEAGIER